MKTPIAIIVILSICLVKSGNPDPNPNYVTQDSTNSPLDCATGHNKFQ